MPTTDAVEVRLRVSAPPVDVFNAFADPQQIARFWFPKVSGPLAPDAEVEWYVGTDPDAFAIDVRVTVFEPGQRLAYAWGKGDDRVPVEWTFRDDGADGTLLTVRESGHSAADPDTLARLLDSTGGYNQVVVAAKAWLEHGVAVNVVEAKA